MKPKEKAIQLVDKFENHSFEDINRRISAFSSAKQCALLAVDELIKETGSKYWYNVKLEIEKL